MTKSRFHNKIRYLSLAIAILSAMLIIAYAVYFNQVRAAVRTSVTDYMTEIAAHDMVAINGELLNNWKALSATADRVRANKPDSIEDLCAHLNSENLGTDYQHLYLVDDAGTAYSSALLVENFSDKPFVQKLLAGEERFCTHYNEVRVIEESEENIVFAVRIKPFTVAGKQMIGILGTVNSADIGAFSDVMKVDIYNGKGTSSVVDEAGNYIINPNQMGGIGKIPNFYSWIGNQSGTGKRDTIRSAMLAKKAGTYVIGKNNDLVVDIMPFANTDWYFVITAPEQIFSAQINNLVKTTSTIFAAIVVLLIVMAIIIVRAYIVNANSMEKARSSFLSSMSHEIRTPLNGIVGLNKLMQDSIDDKDKLQDYLNKSVSTSQYLLSLVTDILDISKLRAGKMEILQRPLSLSALVKNVETIIGMRMVTKDQSFSVQSDIQADTVIGDKTRIEQILLNILSNAHKYTPDGGQIALDVRQELHGRKVLTVFTITDNGIGMSEEFQKEIFKDFSREMTRESEGASGTGLGMAISHVLALTMNGNLTVKSKLGEGSCFTFTLNSEVTEEAPENLPASQAQDEIVKESCNILVAEDNDLNAEIMVELLTRKGMTVTRAANGEEALHLFRDSAAGVFEVILMDVQMPVMDGYEAARRIRQLTREDAQQVIIIACSANSFLEDKEQALASGMNDYVVKPVDYRKLIEKIHLLRGNRS